MELRPILRDRWVWAQFALLLLIAVGVPLLPRAFNLGILDSILGRADSRLVRMFGWPIIVAGIGFGAWAVASLGPNLTPSVEPVRGATMVRTGAYAHCRHPIYFALVLVVTGYTLLWSNWRLALVVGVITLAFFSAKASAEERLLSRRFRDYAEYRRWVPKILPLGRR
jgi:protein-S-isoprenylcysteine O-methyltransferase Ste14